MPVSANTAKSDEIWLLRRVNNLSTCGTRESLWRFLMLVLAFWASDPEGVVATVVDILHTPEIEELPIQYIGQHNRGGNQCQYP